MKRIAIIESKRSNEFRIPIHPLHFSLLNPAKNSLFFQSDYGSRFEKTKGALQKQKITLDTRDNLLEMADVVFLLKPTKSDLEKLKEGSTLVGWCHAVQQIDIAKTAVNRNLTLVSMELMYETLLDQSSPIHLFYENNYITGFEGVLHALSNVPIKYPDTTKIAIISYGNVSQGATEKLKALGYKNITVFTRRKNNMILNKLDTVSYHTLIVENNSLFDKDGKPLGEALKEFDIIVNGIKQDPVNPYIFFTVEQLKSVKNKLLIDLSCDDNMGFEFSHETTWENPVILLYHNYYYAIPNVPSIAWENVSELISKKLTSIVNAYLEDQFSSDISKLLEEATEIKGGKIINPKIIQYQKKLGFL
jgi:alanine dehydrogenase